MTVKANKLKQTPDATLREMLQTIESLLAVYEEETALLKAADADGFIAMQDRKISVLKSYEAGMCTLMANKDEIKKADPSLKDQVRVMQARFAESAKQNMDALARMNRCAERLGNSLRHAAIVSAQKQRTYSYGETGAITGGGQAKPVSSGLSETA